MPRTASGHRRESTFDVDVRFFLFFDLTYDTIGLHHDLSMSETGYTYGALYLTPKLVFGETKSANPMNDATA